MVNGRDKKVGESTKTMRKASRSRGKNKVSKKTSANHLDRNVRSSDQAFAAHFGAGNTSARAGNYEAALQSFKHALEIRPNEAFVHSNIAFVCLRMGARIAAVENYRKALAIDPCYYQAQYSLSNTLHELGQVDDAIAGYRLALDLNPNSEGAYLNLGNAFKDKGLLDQAKACYIKATDLAPRYGAAWRNLAAVYCDLKNFEMAVTASLRALEIEPDTADAHYNLAIALQGLGRFDSAIKEYRCTLCIAPHRAGAHLNLGIALGKRGLLDEAVTSLKRAISIDPELAEAHSSLGNLLTELGKLGPAIQSFRQALQINPHFPEARSNLLLCLCHQAGTSAELLFAEHLAYGAQHDSDQIGGIWSSERFATPNRNLRIGLVSADLRNHAVINFLMPILAQLSRRPLLSLWAYSNNSDDDRATEEIKTHFERWTSVSQLSDDDLVKRIRDDSIDILIDLSGHTGGNRLPAFCKRAAPIQVSWLGYPCTTGVREMDYYIADRAFISDKEISGQFTEKLVYLPAAVAFTPAAESPPSNCLPALGNGYLTFGSFNRLSKISPATIELWSQLLRMIPTSRLMLAAVPADATELVCKWFMAEGIERARLDFYPRCSMSTYLRLYHRVDLCLDSFPYSGGTTTCHGLWMGVPTLTLTGDCPQSRVGAAILATCGLEQFSAKSSDHFVELGIAASKDCTTLSSLRANMRAKMQKSMIMRPDLIASSMEAAFVEMWRRRSLGYPNDILDVSQFG